MTPVASIGTLRFGGGLAGSVQLEPEGLPLARPGILTMVTAATPPTGQRLIGFSGTASGDRVALDLAALGSGQIVLPISPFSLHGGGFGTAADLAQFQTNRRRDAAPRALRSVYDAWRGSGL